MGTGTLAVEPILWTKLHRPQLDADLVDRGRLIESMNRGLEVPLTLVSAPAGYGKSVLVAQWAEQLNGDIAWLSLDTSDSELRTFLRYFVSAVHTVSPGACDASRELLHAKSLPPLPVLANYLLNDLNAIGSPCVIALDDYHRIETLSPVQDLMLRILEHPPQQFRIVVLTRRDPPFDLLGLRAGHRIVEVRLKDLRFTADETGAFLSASTGLPVPDETLGHLQREVEGWAVGLRLVSLALRNARDAEEFLNGLPELLPELQEYLLKEVLTAQPAEVRDRMLASAILDRFCAGVLDAVCESSDADDGSVTSSSEFLKDLHKNNLFTIPLDTRQEWFRYHHLFQELLLGELKRQRGEAVLATLHQRASEWFESQSLIDEALKHALAGRNEEAAAGLVIRHRIAAINANEWHALANWMSLIPETVVLQRAELLLTRAWIHIRHYFHLEPVPELIDQAESLLGNDHGQRDLRGELALCRAFLFWLKGQGDRSLELVELARPDIPDTQAEFLRVAEMIFAVSSQMVGQSEQAIHFVDEQLSRVDPLREGRRRVQLLYTKVFIHLMAAELPMAELAQRRLRDAVEQTELTYERAWTDYMEGLLHLNRCEWAEAIEFLSSSAERRFIHHRRAATDSLIGLAFAYRALGNDKEAAEAMQTLQDYVASQIKPGMDVLVTSATARLSVLDERPAPARSWLAASEPPVESDLAIWIEVPFVTRCWARVAIGSPGELAQAEQDLLTCLGIYEKQGNTVQLIRVNAVLAMAYEKQGKRKSALRALESAATMAAKGDLVFPFVELGAPMVELLRDIPSERGFTDRVKGLVADFGAAADSSDGWRVATGGDQKGLTNREHDVLVLLAERLQDKEISARLGISPQTVNSHLKQIYHKLGVHGRRKAIEKASESGILVYSPPHRPA